MLVLIKSQNKNRLRNLNCKGYFYHKKKVINLNIILIFLAITQKNILWDNFNLQRRLVRQKTALNKIKNKSKI